MCGLKALEDGGLELLVHAITPNSLANGPGRRLVIHTQGCSLRCPGCFNPPTWSKDGGERYRLEALLERIRRAPGDGVTISGGEPTEQIEAVTVLCERLREDGISVVLFSGRRLEQIEALPLGPRLLSALDVLIDGPFLLEEVSSSGLRGSSNQQIHCLSDRYTPKDLEARVVEIIIDSEKEVVMTGFPDASFEAELRRRIGGGQGGSADN